VLASAPVLLIVRSIQTATKAVDSAVGNVSAACDRATPKLSLPTKVRPSPHARARRRVYDRKSVAAEVRFVVAGGGGRRELLQSLGRLVRTVGLTYSDVDVAMGTCVVAVILFRGCRFW